MHLSTGSMLACYSIHVHVEHAILLWPYCNKYRYMYGIHIPVHCMPYGHIEYSSTRVRTRVQYTCICAAGINCTIVQYSIFQYIASYRYPLGTVHIFNMAILEYYYNRYYGITGRYCMLLQYNVFFN